MGGHAAAILKASEPTGWLFGFDRDGTAIESAGERLSEYAGRFELRRARFDEMSEWVEAQSCDAVLLDLGVSSPQLDEGERGFSFQRDAPLDMRMDQRQGLTAADIVNDADIDDLTRVFRDLGGERRARQFARAIERERKMRRIETTGQLANLLERIAPRIAAGSERRNGLFAARVTLGDGRFEARWSACDYHFSFAGGSHRQAMGARGGTRLRFHWRCGRSGIADAPDTDAQADQSQADLRRRNRIE
jgi:16S rRNA (cytosine1402-N4)-methyltransferase